MDDPDILSQASRNNVMIRQNILQKVLHRQASNQIEIEQKAAKTKINDEMRLMRKSLLPSVAEEEKGTTTRPSMQHRSSQQRLAAIDGKKRLSSVDGKETTTTTTTTTTSTTTKAKGKRSKSEGGTFGRNPSGSEGTFPSIPAPVPPLSLSDLKQKAKEENRRNSLRSKSKYSAMAEKDLDDKLQTLLGVSPRSLSVDVGSKGKFGSRGSISHLGSNAEPGLTMKQLLWLKSLAPEESIFIDDDGDRKNSDDRGDDMTKPDIVVEGEDEEDDEVFPLHRLPPTKLPPIFSTESRIIGNQNQDLKPSRHQSLSQPRSSGDWSILKSTRYLRAKPKRIQDWYDDRRRSAFN